MKPGDKVICIFVENGAKDRLTKNKKYEVMPVPEGMSFLSDTIYVVDNFGNVGGYFKWRFKPADKMKGADVV